MKFLWAAARFLILIFAGVLLSFAHPFEYDDWSRASNFGWLIVATLGLLLLISTSLSFRSLAARFFAGFVGALSFYLITIYWIVLALREYGNIPLPISAFACFLLSGYSAVFIGIWAMIAGTDFVRFREPFRKALAIAALWAALEAIRQCLFSGFNWGELGFAFSVIPPFAKTASIWGVHGLTFIWVLFCLLILQIEQFNEKPYTRSVVTTFIFLLIVGTIGVFLPVRLEEKVPVRIAAIQPDIAQEMKWKAGRANENLNELVQLSNSVLPQNPELIVWPETAYPFLVSANQKQMPFPTTVPLIAGAVVKEGSINRNSALLIDQDQILQRFDKIHLVPFGEYVPLADYLPFGKLVANVGDFKPGSRSQEPLSIPRSFLKAGPLICFEDAFSDLSVHHAKEGANLLVNITNDAWYGRSSAQMQHAAMSTLQVYMTGLPMVRATNNGKTSFISWEKRIDKPSFEKLASVEEILVPKNPKKTFFVLTYPLMEWIWFLLFGIALIWPESHHQRIRRRKKIFFPA